MQRVNSASPGCSLPQRLPSPSPYALLPLNFRKLSQRAWQIIPVAQLTIKGTSKVGVHGSAGRDFRRLVSIVFLLVSSFLPLSPSWLVPLVSLLASARLRSCLLLSSFMCQVCHPLSPFLLLISLYVVWCGADWCSEASLPSSFFFLLFLVVGRAEWVLGAYLALSPSMHGLAWVRSGRA